MAGPRVRPAGRHGPAGLRLVRAAALRARQPAAQPAARLPVPDDAPRGRAARERRASSSPSAAAAGWCATRSGTPPRAPGRPLVNAERWDTGVEARVGVRPLSFALAVTQGTLSHPELEDENGGKQVSARLAWTPVPAFVAGVSGASGDFVADAALAALPGRRCAGELPAAGAGVGPGVGDRPPDPARRGPLQPLGGCPRSMPPASRTRSTRSARSSRDATSCARASTSPRASSG